MASPEVWTDARARLEAAALGGTTIAWPNEPFDLPEPLAPYLVAEISGDMSEPIELGSGGTWQEDGTVWVHVMVPVGEGITAGLALRKTIANLFRGVIAGGIVYRSAQMDPGGTDDEGNWFRLSLGVQYIFQDR